MLVVKFLNFSEVTKEDVTVLIEALRMSRHQDVHPLLEIAR